MPLDLHDDVGFAYAAPAEGVSTREARAMLPAQSPHPTAADALGRVVALVRGLATADPGLIRIGMLDELHVPYRLQLIPRADEAMAAGLDAGAWAVTVSGAGSGLIALCSPADAAEVGAAMHGAFDDGSGDSECVGFAVRPSMVGVQRLELE
jgi:homoserine kinase